MTASLPPEHDSQLHHHAHTGKHESLPFVLLTHDVSHPENVGSLFRLADAFGIAKLFLCGDTPAPPHTKIRRVARATDQHVPWESVPDTLTLVKRLKREGYTCVCLEITQQSVDVATYRLPADGKVCLLVGAESQGVPDTILAACDVALHIPMRGVNSSMNVAMACGVASYLLSQQLLTMP